MKHRRTLALAALLASCLAAFAATGPAALAQTSRTAATHGAGEEQGVAAPRGMKVRVSARQAPGGILVHAVTRRFHWAPRHLSPIHGQGQVIIGEGHGHIYVDGSPMPALMVVGPWTYLRLEPGRHTVRVTLNANNHAEYHRHGHPVQDITRVTVPEPPSMHE